MSIASQIAAATVRQKAAAEAMLEASPDRCNIISTSDAPDGFGGTTTTETTIASDVPMLYEFATYGSAQAGGSSLAHITHDLYVIADTVTRGIGPHHRIVVLERDDVPEFIFDEPVQLEETFGPLVHLGAAKRS